MKKLYQKKIVYFMWAKHKQLKKFGVVSNYMTEEIEKDVLNWLDGKAKRVYNEMKLNICELYNSSGLGTTTCSYCIYTGFVHGVCFYGKVQGICTWSMKSVYHCIRTELDENGYNTINVLTNKFYRKLIKEIEKKFKEGK